MNRSGPRTGARVSSDPVAQSFPPITLLDAASSVAGAEIRDVSVHGGTVIRDVAFDSRSVVPGALFFCVPGAVVDGHEFALLASEAGAAALVVERWLDLEVPQVRVASVRHAMGPMSAVLFGRPAESMVMVGITGTNGKTTVTYLLESIFDAAGMASGVIGTTGGRIEGEAVALARTTPEAPDLHRLLARMRDAGVRAVALEVSSHALAQDRVDGIVFDVAMFTNLSQDHLDYHPSMEAYFAAKARLFTPEHARRAVINTDDRWGSRLLEAMSVPVMTFAVDAPADLHARDVVSTVEGSRFNVDGLDFRSHLRGGFNVSNCLGAIAVARTIGIEDAAIVAGVEALPGVPGRVEAVDAGQDFLVVVDYAHTPDSIHGVLQAVRPLASGRLIVVFGCGGDRDRAKRPLMGAAATSIADLTIITSDNPRSEDPLAIIGQIEPGAIEGGGAYVIEPERRDAIRLAVGQARPQDVVVIAGKGHEPHQEMATGNLPFDDREVAREELRALGAQA